MNCVIINKNYPPNSGTTGFYASKLAEYLNENGVDVKIITTDSKYGGALINSKHKCVYRIRSIYGGKNKYFRIISSVYEGFRMAIIAAKLKPAVIICMTDPPLLNLWIGLQAKKNKIPWIYWSMDLYPETFVAARLVTPENLVYKIINGIVKKNEPDFLITLGELQAKYIVNQYCWSVPHVTLPCCSFDYKINSDRPSWASCGDKIIFGYIGNLGEAHNANFILDFSKSINCEKHVFIIKIYGKKSTLLLSLVKNMKGVVILDQVNDSELAFIDIHLTTLLPEWDHICVPSKSLNCICYGGALLYCGTRNNDTWKLLMDCGWIIEECDDIIGKIRCFLENLSEKSLDEKKINSQVKMLELIKLKSRAQDAILKFIKQRN
jgi:glycosyltransferase involved in cell wall biosynthesis